MTTTLTTIRDRVETILADTANNIWTTSDLDEAIRQSLAAYSQARPVTNITTLTLTTDGREIDTSSISNLDTIIEVWINYDSEDPDHPPSKRPFRFWPDEQLIYIMGAYEPTAGDVARIFYTTPHTLSGLDSATTTTIPTAHDTIITQGAAAYAALSRALDLNEQVTIDRSAVEQQQAWSDALMSQFKQALTRVTAGATDSAAVTLPPLDRHDTQTGWS
jgi:hypothetical protein